MTDITVNNLTFSYDGVPVLRDVSLVLPAGRITCLMGPSGCGKTTLFRLLCGSLVPNAGHIDGLPERISAVFQEDRLCEDFSAVSNIRFVTGNTLPKSEIAALLSSFGLEGDSPAPVRTFSGGMKRRVAIARALAAEGELLLLDEPFKGLDEELRAAVAAVVKAHTTGKTVLVITHDAEEAALLGASVLEMGPNGQISPLVP